MTSATALLSPLGAHQPDKARLRLLAPRPVDVPLARHAPKRQPLDPGNRLEGFALLILAAAIHGAIAWGAYHRNTTQRAPTVARVIEFVRPEVEPPPPPVEPPKKIIPPKVVQAVPPPALRTAPAEAPQPDTIAIQENLTAPRNTGPVVAAPPAPAPAPAPAAAPPVEEAVIEANGSAAYLNNPPPIYPKAAQRRGLQGRVLLRVQVLASGLVGSIEVKQSSGQAMLDDAALSAVKGWVFVPAKRGRTAVDGWTTVPMEFRLSS